MIGGVVGKILGGNDLVGVDLVAENECLTGYRFLHGLNPLPKGRSTNLALKEEILPREMPIAKRSPPDHRGEPGKRATPKAEGDLGIAQIAATRDVGGGKPTSSWGAADNSFVRNYISVFTFCNL